MKARDPRNFYEPLSEDESMVPSDPQRTMPVFVDDDSGDALLYTADGTPLTFPKRSIGFGR